MSLAIPLISMSVLNIATYIAIKKRIRPVSRSAVNRTMSVDTTCTSEISRTIQEPTRSDEKASSSRHNWKETSLKRSQENIKSKISRLDPQKKVALLLFAASIALLIFWLPYSVLTVVISTCSDCINEDVYEFFVWFLWLKAGVDPFLYAYNSARFRKNVVEILWEILYFCSCNMHPFDT